MHNCHWQIQPRARVKYSLTMQRLSLTMQRLSSCTSALRSVIVTGNLSKLMGSTRGCTAPCLNVQTEHIMIQDQVHAQPCTTTAASNDIYNM